MKKMTQQKECNLTATFLPKRKRVLNRKLRVLNKPASVKRTKVDKVDDAVLDSQASMPDCLLDSQVPLA